MTVEQKAALKVLSHFKVIATTGKRELIVQGSEKVYLMSPGGLLTPFRHGRAA